MGELSPFVYWAQTESHISLKVDLKNVKSPEVILNEDELEFTAIGLGAKGRNEYHFVLEFYLAVDPQPQKSQYKVTDREIEFNIAKKVVQWWPRLTVNQVKPAWLKIDFDKWKSEDDDEVDQNDINETMKELFDPKKEDEMREEAYQRIYMFMYNLFMFCGFTVVAIMMLIYVAKDGADGIKNTYSNVGGLFVFFQVFQLFEIPFALIGWTATKNVMFPLLQIGGRLTHFFIMVVAEPKMQSNPAVFYLLMVWCLAEVFRYPYYMLKILDFEVHILTWLRYSMWIVLYPIGLLCEDVIIFLNITHFQESKRFSFHLPNSLNWSFDLPSIMRFYLLFLSFPLAFLLISNMYRQRRRQLGLNLKKKRE